MARQAAHCALRVIAVEPVVTHPASVIADVALSISASIRAARDGALLGRIPAGFFESDSKVDSFSEKEGGGRRADRDRDRDLTQRRQVPADRKRAEHDEPAARDPAG